MFRKRFCNGCVSKIMIGIFNSLTFNRRVKHFEKISAFFQSVRLTLRFWKEWTFYRSNLCFFRCFCTILVSSVSQQSQRLEINNRFKFLLLTVEFTRINLYYMKEQVFTAYRWKRFFWHHWRLICQSFFEIALKYDNRWAIFLRNWQKKKSQVDLKIKPPFI